MGNVWVPQSCGTHTGTLWYVPSGSSYLFPQHHHLGTSSERKEIQGNCTAQTRAVRHGDEAFQPCPECPPAHPPPPRNFPPHPPSSQNGTNPSQVQGVGVLVPFPWGCIALALESVIGLGPKFQNGLAKDSVPCIICLCLLFKKLS